MRLERELNFLFLRKLIEILTNLIDSQDCLVHRDFKERVHFKKVSALFRLLILIQTLFVAVFIFRKRLRPRLLLSKKMENWGRFFVIGSAVRDLVFYYFISTIFQQMMMQYPFLLLRDLFLVVVGNTFGIMKRMG